MIISLINTLKSLATNVGGEEGGITPAPPTPSVSYIQRDFGEFMIDEPIITDIEWSEDLKLELEMIMYDNSKVISNTANSTAHGVLDVDIYNRSTWRYDTYKRVYTNEAEGQYYRWELGNFYIYVYEILNNNEMLTGAVGNTASLPADLVGEKVVIDANQMVLHSFKAYKGNVLVAEYVPAENKDGEYGLWEKVSNTFTPYNANMFDYNEIIEG